MLNYQAEPGFKGHCTQSIVTLRCRLPNCSWW